MAMSQTKCLCEYNSRHSTKVRYLYPKLAKKSKKSNICYTNKCPDCVKISNHCLKVRKIHIVDFLHEQTQSKPYSGKLIAPKKDDLNSAISVISDFYDDHTLFTIENWDRTSIIAGKVVGQSEMLVVEGNLPEETRNRDGLALVPVSFQQQQQQQYHDFNSFKQTSANVLNKPEKVTSDSVEEFLAPTDAMSIKTEHFILNNKGDNENVLNSNSNLLTMKASIPSSILSRLRRKYLSSATGENNIQQSPLESQTKEADLQSTGDGLLIMIDWLRDMSTQIGEENVHEALKSANERYERSHSKRRYLDKLNFKNYWNQSVI